MQHKALKSSPAWAQQRQWSCGWRRPQWRVPPACRRTPTGTAGSPGRSSTWAEGNDRGRAGERTRMRGIDKGLCGPTQQPAQAGQTGAAHVSRHNPSAQLPAQALNPPGHCIGGEEVKLQHLHALGAQAGLEVEARAALRGHNGGRVTDVPQVGLLAARCRGGVREWCKGGWLSEAVGGNRHTGAQAALPKGMRTGQALTQALPHQNQHREACSAQVPTSGRSRVRDMTMRAGWWPPSRRVVSRGLSRRTAGVNGSGWGSS